MSGTTDDPARELRRVVARLASLSSERVDRRAVGADDSPAVGDRVRDQLQHLADVAADAEGRPRSLVPRLASHALGDQLSVLVDDALAVVDADGRADVAARLTALRRTL